MRIFALSDLHVDYEENLRWVENLSQQDYVHDILILAGDVSHDQDLFIRALEALRSRFYRIFFVPGNHDLWLRSTDTGDSLTKHHELLGLCQRLEIQTAPENVDSITIVPLQAWYVEPEEDPQESLFVPKHGEDPSLSRWVDRRAIRWPELNGHTTPASYFLAQNNPPSLQNHSARIIISFSHFVPRTELIFPTVEELQALGIPLVDPQPRFNFSRVAGCRGLERQIRTLGSTVHVYGHQHRNRRRHIDGITYVSHCLGYPRERAEGRITKGLHEPLQIWDTDTEALS